MQKEEIIYIPIDSIIKSSCNQRDELNEDHVYKMVDTLKRGQWLPPLFVRKEGDYYGCFDGANRYSAYVLSGIKEVPVIVKQVSDEVAITLSYISNCGQGWTDAENADTCLKLYQGGMDVGTIIERLSEKGNNYWSHDNVKKYIKIAAWLHPDLKIKIKKGGKNGFIPIHLAAKLADTSHENQMRVYNNCCNQKGEKDKLVDDWYQKNPHLHKVRNISELRTRTKKSTTPVNTTKPKVRTSTTKSSPAKTVQPKDNHSEFIQKLNNMIDGYCNDGNCDRLRILEILSHG